MANEVGSSFIMKSNNFCIFCKSNLINNPYQLQDSLYEYDCGCLMKLSYDYKEHNICGESVMLYDTVYTILRKCVINYDFGDLRWKIPLAMLEDIK